MKILKLKNFKIDIKTAFLLAGISGVADAIGGVSASIADLIWLFGDLAQGVIPFHFHHIFVISGLIFSLVMLITSIILILKACDRDKIEHPLDYKNKRKKKKL